MVDAGMDGCRINMSHCSHELGRELAATVRRLSAELGRPIALGADLRGPKLRIGDVAGGTVLLAEGSSLHLTSEDRATDCHTISVDYPFLAEDVRPGDPILLNDGAIALRVEEVRGGRVVCRVEKGGPLSSRKGINFPGVPLRVPSLTEKDLGDMAFAVEAQVDFLFVSYARSRAHLREVRAALARLGSHLPLVAKIERQEGVEALAEIVEEADGVCVARGDLGIETPLGSVPEIQREAVRLCRREGKFVMLGGQLLSTMVGSPIPLRAEVSDVATSARDGFDALVLSDETAVGSYPVETVRAAAQVIARAESVLQAEGGLLPGPPPSAGALGPVAVASPDGRAAMALSASRAARPIVALVEQPHAAHWLSTWWGVVPILVEDCSDPAAVRRALDAAAARNPSISSARLLNLYER